MGYSRNFGMRSFENIVRDGRFRVPKTGDPYLIGSAVVVDPANAGLLTRPGAAAAPSPGCGIVLYEHILKSGVDSSLTTTSDAPFNAVPRGQYAQMIHGPGAKVWFKNTEDGTFYDGRPQDGVTLVNGAPSVGDFLIPAADGTWDVGGDAATGWLFVEQSNPDTGLVEARFTF